ncbi:MAG: hypothetical protein M3R14_07540 [Acidobacteriota bacterium]|nr:hypothetical protein [Acidobacteriota bacterium]
MKFADLKSETIEKLKTRLYDRIVEKHEGPWDWKWQIEHSECEFIQADGHFILLPVYFKHHPNISILRVVESNDEKVLTVFLKDTTYDDDDFFTGFVAICERFVGEEFFTAIVYHEWFIVENSE